MLSFPANIIYILFSVHASDTWAWFFTIVVFVIADKPDTQSSAAFARMYVPNKY